MLSQLTLNNPKCLKAPRMFQILLEHARIKKNFLKDLVKASNKFQRLSQLPRFQKLHGTSGNSPDCAQKLLEGCKYF